MSLFGCPKKSRKGRNNYRRVVHSISDSETDEQHFIESSGASDTARIEQPLDNTSNKKITSSSKLLSYLHDEEEESDVTVFKLKKPDHSKQQQRLKRSQKVKEKLEASVKPVEVAPIKEDVNALVQVSQGVIPNAAAIHAARKKRELARNTGADTSNYISISSSEGTQQDSQRTNVDDDNSDEESQVRQFGIQKDTSKQMEVLSAMDNAESGSDEDKFEEEQIHKGSYAFPANSGFESQTAPMQYEEPVQVQGVDKPVAVLESSIKLTPISMESVQSQLRTQLTQLREQHSSNEDSIKKLVDDLETAHSEIEEAEGRSLNLSMRYQFFQETRGYVKDLLLCLTEKVPKIKDMEDGILNVLKQKSDLLIERRRLDVEDAVEECAGKIDPVRHSRIVEREGRRRRRKEMRNKIVESAEYYEGQSSDDELLHSTKNKFESDIDEVISEQGGVFSDVLDDFSSISKLIMRFREWKYNFPESYDQAYISLCLPKLLAPYVQLELIPWKPNIDNYQDILESSSWMDQLLFFVEQYKSDEVFDVDVNIIPRIIELTVLPKLTNIINSVWDPLSTSETTCITNLISYIVENFPSISLECRSFQDTSRTITKRIRSALQNDVFVPMFPQEKMQDSTSLHYRFSQRQFWSSFKLLKNIVMFYGILRNEVWIELVFDGLINRYMLLSLQNAPVSTLSVIKLRMIFSLLPTPLWTSGCSMEKHFAGLIRYISNILEILQKNLLTEPESSKLSIRNSIKEAEDMLLRAKRNH